MIADLIHRMEVLNGSGQVTCLVHAFAAFSGDVITCLYTDQPRDDLLDKASFSLN